LASGTGIELGIGLGIGLGVGLRVGVGVGLRLELGATKDKSVNSLDYVDDVLDLSAIFAFQDQTILMHYLSRLKRIADQEYQDNVRREIVIVNTLIIRTNKPDRKRMGRGTI
jgi:hypothetical protein